MRQRSSIVALAVGIAILGLAVWFTRPVGDGFPLDPRGTGQAGTAALFRTLDRLGADVTVTGSVPSADADTSELTIVVLVDRLDDDRRADVAGLVDRGARLVLFDPRSPLNPVDAGIVAPTDLFGPLSEEPHCPLLAGVVASVASTRWTPLYPGDRTVDQCFPVDDGFGMVVHAVGQGEVVVTSAVDALVNRELDAGDHARWAVAMLAPTGEGRVVVVWDTVIGAGGQSLVDVMPEGAKRGFWVLLAAVVLYAGVRARRLGRPVAEQLPVRVPASELALSIGDLLARYGHRDAAAARLRADLRREVALALHVPADTPPDVLVELVNERAGADLDGAGVRLALLDGPVTDDDALLAMAAALARVRARTRGQARGHAGRAPASR